MKLHPGRLIIASAFIVLGVVFLIGNLDIIDVDVRDFDCRLVARHHHRHRRLVSTRRPH